MKLSNKRVAHNIYWNNYTQTKPTYLQCLREHWPLWPWPPLLLLAPPSRAEKFLACGCSLGRDHRQLS